MRDIRTFRSAETILALKGTPNKKRNAESTFQVYRTAYTLHFDLLSLDNHIVLNHEILIIWEKLFNITVIESFQEIIWHIQSIHKISQIVIKIISRINKPIRMTQHEFLGVFPISA